MSMIDFSAEQVQALCAATIRAGRNAMRHYGHAHATQKADNSPVTLADKEGEAIMLAALADLLPELQVVGEESSEAGLPTKLASQFFLLDPLDGTKEFLEQRKDFTVNLGLIADGVPVFGIIYAPARAEIFFTHEGAAWWAQDVREEKDFVPTQAVRIAMRPPPKGGLTVVASRSHAGNELVEMQNQYTIADSRNAGSSLKFCLLALGEADLYPRFGPTMEWDIAAGHAILRAAGGELIQINGNTFAYGKLPQGLKNPGFIAKHPDLPYAS